MADRSATMLTGGVSAITWLLAFFMVGDDDTAIFPSIALPARSLTGVTACQRLPTECEAAEVVVINIGVASRGNHMSAARDFALHQLRTDYDRWILVLVHGNVVFSWPQSSVIAI